MRVGAFRSSTEGDRARVGATVTWEDCDRPQRQIWFETDARFAEDATPSPDAFLLAVIMPAMRNDERRVLVDGPVCPRLRNGLITAMLQMRQWYGEAHHRPVTIEATEGFRPRRPRTPPRTALFLSGGVDALATLRCNRLDFPLDHPGSIRDGLFVHGFDVGAYEALPGNQENSALAVASLGKLAEETGLTLIPVWTNLRHLDEDDVLFFEAWYGAALAAVAHVFSRRTTEVMIAAGSSIADLGPIGSHPLLDPHYSSAALAIRHDGIRFSRLEKVGLISGWEAGLGTLRACFDAFRPPDALNCGRCEKCIRTMAELLVHGKLEECPTYALDDLSPDMLRTIRAAPPARAPAGRREELQYLYLMLNVANVHYWRELVGPLRSIGRGDLAEVVEEKLAEYERFEARRRARGWQRTVRRLDGVWFGGRLSRWTRMLRGRSRSGG